MTKGRAWLLLLLLCLAAAPPIPIDRLLDRMEMVQKDVRTLQAEFIQKNRSKLFRQELVSRGRMLYERGARPRLRWDYISPDPSTLLLLGKRAYLKMPGQKERAFDLDRDATMQAIFSEILLWLGNGSLRDARSEYQIISGGSADAPTIVLIPRENSPIGKTFVQIELRLSQPGLLLRQIALRERSGDEKEITFVRMDRNARLAESVFQP